MSATSGGEPSPAARPTQVQMLAAKVRMKADRRLNRASPEKIQSIAAADGVMGNVEGNTKMLRRDRESAAKFRADQTHEHRRIPARGDAGGHGGGEFLAFIARGNVIELAVAFVIAVAFLTLVTAVVDVMMDLVGKIGGVPGFSNYEPEGISIGAFLTALIAFLLLVALIYFFVVVPHNRLMDRMDRGQEVWLPTEDVLLLIEIRDKLLEAQRPGSGGAEGEAVRRS